MTNNFHSDSVTPDFDQFRKLLAGEKPDRPVVFEHYVDACHVNRALGNRKVDNDNPPWGWMLNAARGYAALGCDCIGLSDYWAKLLRFELPQRETGHSIGQYADGMITNEASMEAYPWPEPDFARAKMFLDGIGPELPGNMKMNLGFRGPYDLLAELMGFENLCLTAMENPGMLEELCRRIGQRQMKLVEGCIDHPALGGVQICDDWGFKTSTFLSPEDLRRFIFPWHKKVVDAAHAAGKVAILHACGNVSKVMEDVLAMGYDAKHSYEDAICPVEQMWKQWGGRITILGGLDVDFLARSTTQAVRQRCDALLELTQGRRYAIGSGNSVTPDIPWENYMAMLAAVGRTPR